MYAIVETGGKQYCVEPGDHINVELISGDQDSTIDLGEVLLIKKDDGEVLVGQPTVEGATVTAKILGTDKGPKVIAFKYKRRKNYRRKVGHRQHYTSVEIVDIKCA